MDPNPPRNHFEADPDIADYLQSLLLEVRLEIISKRIQTYLKPVYPSEANKLHSQTRENNLYTLHYRKCLSSRRYLQ